MTLYWLTLQYQCNVYPQNTNTLYSCNTSDTTNVIQCDTSLQNYWIDDSIMYALQIDTFGSNNIRIDQVIIMEKNDQLAFSVFCSNYSDFHCNSSIELNSNSKYIMIEFDINSTSDDYMDAYISDQTYPITCIPDGYGCMDRFNTPKYGGTGGGLHFSGVLSIFDGIKSWGMYNIGNEIAISNFGWNDLDRYGTKFDIDSSCKHFTLNATDYISGYQVIYGEFVDAIYFFTKSNNTYYCGPDNLGSDSTAADTGIWKDNRYHLTGMRVYSGYVMDAISFQFSSDIRDQCSYDFHRYIFVNTAKSWTEARATCNKDYGSDLATIITDKDLKIAITIILYNTFFMVIEADVWIGLTAEPFITHTTGIWQWSDDTTCKYAHDERCMNDKHWARNEPNSVHRRCAAIGHSYVNGLFVTHNLSDKLPFLCNNGPYIIQTDPPTSSPSITLCPHHPNCTYLSGECCPNNDGLYSDCCNNTNMYNHTTIMTTMGLDIDTTNAISFKLTSVNTLLFAIVIVILCIVIGSPICWCWYHSKKGTKLKKKLKKSKKITVDSYNYGEEMVYMRMSDAESLFSK